MNSNSSRYRRNLVSIVTPAYGAAATINDTIRSVLEQTYPHWEMLIVDDCSEDATREIVTEWTHRDHRVKLIRHSQNGGPARARNTAIEAAAGRWLAYLDSDDMWLPEKLEKTLAYAEMMRAALVFTGFRRLRFDGHETGRYIGVPKEITYNQLLKNTVIATSTVILDREIVGDIVMKDTYLDDFSCWLEVLRAVGLGFGLDQDLMRYRVVHNSHSRNKKNSALMVWKVYREIEKLSLPFSVFNFAGYAWNGFFKYRKF